MENSAGSRCEVTDKMQAGVPEFPVRVCVCVSVWLPFLCLSVSHLVDISLSDNEDQLAVFLHHSPIL